jgi:hypothetical protein
VKPKTSVILSELATKTVVWDLCPAVENGINTIPSSKVFESQLEQSPWELEI